MEMHYRGNIVVQINTAEIGQYSANLFLQGHRLTGTTHFRDFEIDSVLDPDIMEGRLELYNGDQLIISRPWLLAFKTGRVDLHLPDDIQVEDSSMVVKLVIENFSYSDSKYQSFLEIVEIINYYYAFAEILKEMNTSIEKEGLQRSQKFSQLLVSREEIRRVNKYAASFNFQKNLNLEYNDPLQLLALLGDSKRLERRAITLTNQAAKSTVKGLLEDRKLFCAGYPGISEKYIDQSTMFQPHIAAGFGRVARMIPDEESQAMLAMADSVYGVFNHLTTQSIYQDIYNGFVVLADTLLVRNQYVACLDVLYNARVIENWSVDVTESINYLDIYVAALEGLMTSYLKVATMAYRKGSVLMADKYYANARDLYNQHKEIVMGKSIATEAFLEFIDEQVAWSYKMIEDEKYYDAIAAIEKANKTSEENGIAVVHLGFDKVYQMGYSGVFESKMDSILQLVEQANLTDALQMMENAKKYSDKNLGNSRDAVRSQFADPAQEIIDQYYQKGIYLLKTPHPEDALEYLIMARSIKQQYLELNDPVLDSLINSAAVPVILKLVSKGEFDTWANRMDLATESYQKALNLQESYEQLDNPEVVEAMEGFKLKIDQRVCVNLSNECFTLEKKAKNRIANKKYAEASQYVEEALSAISIFPDCDINKDKFTEIINQYDDAFEYARFISQLESLLKGDDYQAILSSFFSLESFYRDQNIARFEIEEPNLYKLVKDQNDMDFVIVTAEYFVDKSDFTQAFRYLEFLKQNNVDPKLVKSLQQNIALGLSLEDGQSVKEEKLLKYTKGDKWFRFFKSAYMK